MSYNPEREKRKRQRKAEQAAALEERQQANDKKLRAYLDANCEIASKIEEVFGCTSQELRDLLEGLPR